jgi:glycogen(starch) synthase
MRVLVTTDTLGGVWNYTRELVTGLSRSGCEVTLVSFGRLPHPDQIAWISRETAAGESAASRTASGDPYASAQPFPINYIPTPFKLEWMENAGNDLQASLQLVRDLIEETRPDIIHSNQFVFGAMRPKVPVVLVAHSDVVSWWRAVYGERPPESPFHRNYERLVRLALESADAVVVPSQSALGDLRQSFDFAGSARVIPNGRSAALFNPYSAKRPYALSIGRLWDSGKQVMLLNRPDLPLEVRIAGSTSHPVHGDRGLPRQPRLDWLGDLNDARLVPQLAHALVYVGTSRYEPFGLAPLEAALSRCALLLNDLPTFHEVWGDDALYFARDDADDLVRCLRRLASNEEMCRKLGLAACRRALNRYTASVMVASYLDLYRNLVHASPSVSAAKAETSAEAGLLRVKEVA